MSPVQTRLIPAGNPIEMAAAKFADEIQDAVNLRAITAHFLEHLDALRNLHDGDGINNHPAVLLFVSKLNSLTRFDRDREGQAFNNAWALRDGKPASFDVIPL